MITVQNVSKIYKLDRKRRFIALNQVNLEIEKGEVLGLMGESGSGKSTLGQIILGLTRPTFGKILFKGKEKTTLLPRQIQMIFQDPYSSLNPRMTIHSILSEPTNIYGLPNRVDELLDLVLLPRDAKKRYPHEFSGGQKQRIGIARALALKPEILICDEPISALDVSIQAQIVNLLKTLQKELNLTLLFIAHDLAMIRYLSSRIAVMHEGNLVERGPTDVVFQTPQHPYTQNLLLNQKILLT